LKLRASVPPIALIALITLLAAGMPATVRAAEDVLLLEASINGQETGQTFTVYRSGKILSVSQSDLQSVGIRTGASIDGRVRLGDIANAVTIDEAAQRIAIVVPLDRLATTRLQFQGGDRESVPLAPAPLAGLLDYDLVATRTPAGNVLSGFFDARVSGEAGVVSSTALGYAGATVARSVRLDTVYTYSDPVSLRRIRVGDFVGGGLSWSRPVRLGGVQLTTDFSLRPDLVTFPTPAFFGEATVPSTVDLFINGVRQLSQSVPPGAFEIRQAPIPTGSGAIAVSVTDALGRQTVQTLPFYITDRLLSAGLSSYSVDLGRVRRSYGQLSNDYGTTALVGTARHAWNDALTLEAHAEATRGLALAGLGAVAGVGALGTLSFSAATSRSTEAGGTGGDVSSGSSGTQTSIGIERSSRVISVSASRQSATAGYRDLGALGGAPVTRVATNVNLGMAMGRFGSTNIAYTALRLPPSAAAIRPSDGNEARILSISYFKSVLANVNLAITGFRNFAGGGNGATASLLFPLGDNRSAAVGANVFSGLHSVTAQAAQPTISPGDFGWQLQASEGHTVQRLGQLDYEGTHGRVTLAASSDGHTASERAGLRGALALTPQGVFASNWIEDSFAIVDAGKTANVNVFLDNRPAGRTGPDGKLLLPDLRAYDVNRVSVNIVNLPIDVRVEVPEQLIKPRDRSASLVDFRVRQGKPVQITLVDRNGQPVPVGSVVRYVATGEKAPVGYDGQTFFADIEPNSLLEVTFPSGEKCSTVLRYEHLTDVIPRIGPLPCI
jgi:outer membrane usher protein